MTFDGLLDSPSVSSYRKRIIKDNLRIIREHNANPDKTFTMRANPQFVGLTLDEFRARYTSKVKHPGQENHQIPEFVVDSRMNEFN